MINEIKNEIRNSLSIDQAKDQFLLFINKDKQDISEDIRTKNRKSRFNNQKCNYDFCEKECIKDCVLYEET